MMENLSTWVGVVAGIIGSGIVSWWFFKRSKKSLVVVLRHDAHLIDKSSAVGDKLRVLYEGRAIEALQHIEVQVLNNGEAAITGLVKPLTFKLKDDSTAELLGAETLEVPEGRTVRRNTVDKQTAAFTFDLLNGGEAFVVRLLVNGDVSLEDVAVTISCPDIPAKLKIWPYHPGTFVRVLGKIAPWVGGLCLVAFTAGIGTASLRRTLGETYGILFTCLSTGYFCWLLWLLWRALRNRPRPSPTDSSP